MTTEKLEVVIHVGTYKTGTTAIQNHLYHTNLLTSRGVLYPGTGGILYPSTGLNTNEPDCGIRHDTLCYALCDDKLRDATALRLVHEITAYQKTYYIKRVILSCESWSRNRARETQSLQTLVNVLSSLYDVRIVCCLRNFPSYCVSLYREMCRRRGNALPFAEWFEAEIETGHYLYLAKRLTRIAPTKFVLGAQSVLIELTGVACDLPQENPSLSCTQAEVARRLNAVRSGSAFQSLLGHLDDVQDEYALVGNISGADSGAFKQITGFSSVQIDHLIHHEHY